MKLFLTPLLLLFVLFSFSCFKKNPVSPNLSTTTTTTKTSNSRDSILKFAKTFLGTPYIYAGNSPQQGFDCSGFVSYVFSNFNITLPRSSNSYKNIGKTLKENEFQVGDILVFYGYEDKTNIGHLGIICEAKGMQSKFIHASSGKAKSVTISALDSAHYSNRFYKCISVMKH